MNHDKYHELLNRHGIFPYNIDEYAEITKKTYKRVLKDTRR